MGASNSATGGALHLLFLRRAHLQLLVLEAPAGAPNRGGLFRTYPRELIHFTDISKMGVPPILVILVTLYLITKIFYRKEAWH